MLFDVIATAQGGRAIVNLGYHFGLTEAQAANALYHVVPEIEFGLRRRSSSDEGLVRLLRVLGTGRYAHCYDDHKIFSDIHVGYDGGSIVESVIGPEPIQRRLVNRVSQVTAIHPETLMQMLPFIAALTMGAIDHKARVKITALLRRVTSDPARRGALTKDPFGTVANIISSNVMHRARSRGYKSLGSRLRDVTPERSVPAPVYEGDTA